MNEWIRLIWRRKKRRDQESGEIDKIRLKERDRLRGFATLVSSPSRRHSLKAAVVKWSSKKERANQQMGTSLQHRKWRHATMICTLSWVWWDPSMQCLLALSLFLSLLQWNTEVWMQRWDWCGDELSGSMNLHLGIVAWQGVTCDSICQCPHSSGMPLPSSDLSFAQCLIRIDELRIHPLLELRWLLQKLDCCSAAMLIMIDNHLLLRKSFWLVRQPSTRFFVLQLSTFCIVLRFSCRTWSMCQSAIIVFA